MPKKGSTGNGPRKKPENGIRKVPKKPEPSNHRPYKPTSTKGE